MRRDRAFDAARLDVAAFAAQAGQLAGQRPQADCPRLADSLMAMPGDVAPPAVAWSARGESRPVAGGAAETWVHLQATTTVTLQCQRCLQPVLQPLEVDRWFRFVASEDEAARLDEEIEDDVLVGGKAFDLRELLEDELILGLPIVPRHAECPEPLIAGAEDLAEEAAPNPFAALAALRRPGGR